ncbi:hypothetical protein CDIK_1602 [Cucumispora dikerogammari]|nr:hypothetical protein CDIK_1602 [Cucumispora dikerogammari]
MYISKPIAGNYLIRKNLSITQKTNILSKQKPFSTKKSRPLFYQYLLLILFLFLFSTEIRCFKEHSSMPIAWYTDYSDTAVRISSNILDNKHTVVYEIKAEII